MFSMGFFYLEDSWPIQRFTEFTSHLWLTNPGRSTVPKATDNYAEHTLNHFIIWSLNQLVFFLSFYSEPQPCIFYEQLHLVTWGFFSLDMANSTTSPQTVSSVSLKTKTNNVTVTYIFSMFQANGLCLIWVDFPLFWLAAGFHFLVLVLWYLVEINSNKAPPWTLFFPVRDTRKNLKEFKDV